MTAPATFDPGKKPELKWLAVSRCHVDQRYQRSLESRRSQALIDRLVERFKWSAFQAVLAVKDGKGGYFVIDGQHRAEAARRLGIKEVPGVLLEAASLEEQARAFVEANQSRVAINAFALFHARLAAGDEDAAELGRLCRKAGISIPRYPIPADKIKPGETLALGTLAAIAKKQPASIAVLIFQAVAEPYGGIAGALRADFFAAAALLIVGAEAIKRQEIAASIAAVLRTMSPGDLGISAQRQRETQGGRVADAVARVIRSKTAARQALAGVAEPTRKLMMGSR
jgi:hypothetical protein